MNYLFKCIQILIYRVLLQVAFNGLTWRHPHINCAKLFSRNENNNPQHLLYLQLYLDSKDVNVCLQVWGLMIKCVEMQTDAARNLSENEFKNICIENKKYTTGVCLKLFKNIAK